MNGSHVVLVITITGVKESFPGYFLIKGETLLYFLFYHSLLAVSIVFVCSAAPWTPESWTLLPTSLWGPSEDTQCSHQNGPDKEPFLPSSILAAAALKRRTHAKTCLFGAKELIYTQTSGPEAFLECQRDWHFQKNSKNARIRKKRSGFPAIVRVLLGKS